MTPCAVLALLSNSPGAKTMYLRNGGLLANAKAGPIRQYDFAAIVGDTGERIVFGEKWSVDIRPIDERRQLRRGGREDLAFNHAPEHDLQSQRTRGMDHLQRAANSARLDELDVDAVDAAVQFRQVFGDPRVLIRDDRNL